MKSIWAIKRWQHILHQRSYPKQCQNWTERTDEKIGPCHMWPYIWVYHGLSLSTTGVSPRGHQRVINQWMLVIVVFLKGSMYNLIWQIQPYPTKESKIWIILQVYGLLTKFVDSFAIDDWDVLCFFCQLTRRCRPSDWCHKSHALHHLLFFWLGCCWDFTGMSSFAAELKVEDAACLGLCSSPSKLYRRGWTRNILSLAIAGVPRFRWSNFPWFHDEIQ